VERRENALVAPAALFMGATMLAIPEGAVAGEQILNFYRRLDFVVSDGGGAVA
jgi:hypothetical protein